MPISDLQAAGYRLEWLLRTPSFYRAVVMVQQQQLKLEWAQDSAFRFFPVEADARLGYRLHDADAATNKMLALAGRSPQNRASAQACAYSGSILTHEIDHLLSQIGSLHTSQIFVGLNVIISHMGNQMPKVKIVINRLFQ